MNNCFQVLHTLLDPIFTWTLPPGKCHDISCQHVNASQNQDAANEAKLRMSSSVYCGSYAELPTQDLFSPFLPRNRTHSDSGWQKPGPRWRALLKSIRISLLLPCQPASALNSYVTQSGLMRHKWKSVEVGGGETSEKHFFPEKRFEMTGTASFFSIFLRWMRLYF